MSRKDSVKLKIKNAYVHVTRSCNLSCSYCYFNAGKTLADELSSVELQHFLSELIFLKPEKIIITGGEPLMRRDIFDFIEKFKKMPGSRKIHLCLMSNGILIDGKAALKISGLFDEVRISLDGPSEINDILRGDGSFEGAISAIRNLKDAGASPGVSITVTSINLPGLGGFLTYLMDELFITNIHLSVVKSSGVALNHPEFFCSVNEAGEVIENFWKNRFGKYGLTAKRNGMAGKDAWNCGLGDHINILPDGSVYPCHILSVPEFLLGNIRKERIGKIVSGSDKLAHLKSFDFSELIEVDNHLRDILKKGTCFGELCLKEHKLLKYTGGEFKWNQE